MARYVKFFGLGGGTDGFITGSCNDIQVTSYLQANGPEANINVAIIPKGTGAIVASCPDGTATGGNARGQYAVDLHWQRVGTAATAVASGHYSVLIGGQRNTASGYFSIVMGNTNTASGNYSMAIGGIANIASSSTSVVLGGESNTASTGFNATVVGGYQNTASGNYAVAGGYSNVASGQGAVGLGYDNTASGNYAVAIGYINSAAAYTTAIGINNTATGFSSTSIGYQNETVGEYSTAFGSNGKTYLLFQQSLSAGRFNAKGDRQQSLVTSFKQDELSSAATTVLSLDGTGTTNLIIPDGDNRLWAAKITATAFVSAVSGTTLVLGDSYMAEYTVLFKKVGGVSSVVGTNAGSVIADANMISSAFTFAAGASQELAITFKAPTTANADTFRCVAKVELVEAAY